MKRIITYGTFDLLDFGQIELLRCAKMMGDYLIVALSTDEFNRDEKGKECIFPYEKRKALLEGIRYVDQVIPETSWEQKRTDIHDYDADVLVLGDEWKGKLEDLREEGVELVYLSLNTKTSLGEAEDQLKEENRFDRLEKLDRKKQQKAVVAHL